MAGACVGAAVLQGAVVLILVVAIDSYIGGCRSRIRLCRTDFDGTSLVRLQDVKQKEKS